MTNLKSIIEELAKNSNTEITKSVASFINSNYESHANVKIDEAGNAKITVTLTAEELKYLMLEIYNKI